MDSDLGATAKVADREALQEFIEALHEHLTTIERDLASLQETPGNRERIGSLFRALHTIKGDAAFCQVPWAVAIVHPIETILDRVRRDKLVFGEDIADVIQLAMDRLDDAVDRLARGATVTDLGLPALVAGLERLALAAPDHFSDALVEVMAELAGLDAETARLAPRKTGEETTQADDLRFFLVLAEQLEARAPPFKGRARRLLRLASETNQLAGSPIDPLQLEAAVYMHDVGMMFLTESAWLKATALTAADRTALHLHPLFAAGLLRRMKGWAAAAEMVAQHHEMPNGKGYPAALSGDEICPGASLLAILDAFESITLRYGDHGRNRSLLKAITEINACDRQFAPDWIDAFNQVLRSKVRER